MIPRMKTYSKSILPELEGWEERLEQALQNVEANRTIGRLLSRGGAATVASLKRSPIQQQADFWYRVEVRSKYECWDWKEGRYPAGYGFVAANDRTELTHRISAAYRYGTIPNGLLACHHCDNPPCCNPHHLFIGDTQLNAIDCALKGRTYCPIPACSKLSKALADEIRAYVSQVKSTKLAAMKYKVSTQTIRDIIYGRTWK